MKFEDTDIWQSATKLTVSVYKVTAKFPQSEQFALTNQLRRCSSSIGANFAEGFGRFSTKDKNHFYTMAYGSLLETKNFILLSLELGFMDDTSADKLVSKINALQKQLNTYMKAQRNARK